MGCAYEPRTKCLGNPENQIVSGYPDLALLVEWFCINSGLQKVGPHTHTLTKILVRHHPCICLSNSGMVANRVDVGVWLDADEWWKEPAGEP